MSAERVFVVLREERPRLRSVPAPRSFRFSDVNPLTGRTYARSRFRDLPDYAGAVVEDRLHLVAGEWDVLVQDGEVSDFVGLFEVFEVWQGGAGWQSRRFVRQGTEVLDINDDGAWF